LDFFPAARYSEPFIHFFSSHSRKWRLSQCDARFEVGFDDVKRIKPESKTFTEIRSALQELTHGYEYNTWDKSLSGPK